MEYHIERQGRLFVVKDGTGKPCAAGPLPTVEAASAALAALEAAERERAANDPEVQAQRREKAAYRLAERDPNLRALKHFLPHTGEIERNTREAHERSMKWVDTHMALASSDPTKHAELNKSPAQRKTSRAANTHRQQGAITRESILEREAALSDMPKHKRAGQIAHETGIGVRHVRRLLKQKTDISSA